jgi:nuclear inhibitor of protein phosphatase 1
MASSYEVPSWAGKPPAGLHLDISKDDKFLQKIMIDEKKCYLFGRNPELNDFRIDHSSCSRVHAALVYHRHLGLAYLVDLGSTHGTFVGSIRLESQKPTVVQIGANFHFGASTRYYTLRERVKAQQSIVEDLPLANEHIPATQDEVDNLTEYNTAHNRKISTLGIADVPKQKGKRKRVHFNEEEIVINPEDVDPSVGRFRNLVHSTVVPMSSKRMRLESTGTFSFPPSSHEHKHQLHHHPIIAAQHNLYDGLPSTSGEGDQPYASKFMPMLPNPAPEIESKGMDSMHVQFSHDDDGDHELEPKKKKYAKETWFGPKQRAAKAFGDI